MSAPAEGSALSKDVLLVVFLTGPNNEWISKVRDKYPGLEVRWAQMLRDDKTFVKPDELDPEIWKGVTLICPFIWPPAAHHLSSVRFVQLPSAGIDFWVSHDTYKDKNVVFSTSNGVHAYVMVPGSREQLEWGTDISRQSTNRRMGDWVLPIAPTSFH